jgi:hypothetical protein
VSEFAFSVRCEVFHVGEFTFDVQGTVVIIVGQGDFQVVFVGVAVSCGFFSLRSCFVLGFLLFSRFRFVFRLFRGFFLERPLVARSSCRLFLERPLVSRRLDFFERQFLRLKNPQLTATPTKTTWKSPCPTMMTTVPWTSKVNSPTWKTSHLTLKANSLTAKCC